MAPCSLVDRQQRFGGTYCLDFQGRRLLWKRRQHLSPKRWYLSYNHILEDSNHICPLIYVYSPLERNLDYEMNQDYDNGHNIYRTFYTKFKKWPHIAKVMFICPRVSFPKLNGMGLDWNAVGRIKLYWYKQILFSWTLRFGQKHHVKILHHHYHHHQQQQQQQQQEQQDSELWTHCVP
jgi:hypothetical protein